MPSLPFPASRRSLMIAAVVTALLVGAWLLRAATVPTVSVVLPVRGDAAEVVYATGVVEPTVWAKVVSLQRKRIVEICHCEGRPVKKGDVLARLDDVEERATLAELDARRKRIAEDAERMQALVERNVTSRTTLDEKLTQLAEYEARIAAQKERIGELVLRAPLDGVVMRRDGEVGEIAGTSATDVLFWVGQPLPLRVTADVNEEDILKITVGQSVLLRHEGQTDTPLPARVDSITPKGDPSTKTFRAYFALPDDTPLKVGMTVEANVIVKEAKGVLLVPPASLRDATVLVADSGRVKVVPVEAGVRGTRLVEMRAGLKGDESVIVSPPATLKDGSRIRTRAMGAGS